MQTTEVNKKLKIALTRNLPPRWISKIINHRSFELVSLNNDMPLSEGKLLQLVKNSDIIVSQLTDKIDKSVIEAAGDHLKLIANYAVGFDNIDLQAATQKGIAVANTPDASSQAVAEHTLALILATAKRIVEGDQFVRDGHYKCWTAELMLCYELAGRTLGIIGVGNIGSVVARSCYHGLGMKIIYHDIIKNPELERSTHAYQVSLSNLLSNADVVSLHVPLLPSTHHLIGRAELSRMKKCAILVNTSRGPVVDEAALITALKQKRIFGAALDVFEHEPKVQTALKNIDNVILTPHSASATEQSRAKMGEMLQENVMAVAEGKVPPYLINKEVKSKFKEDV